MISRRKLLKWFGLGSVGLIAGGSTYMATTEPENPYYNGPANDHFDGRIFFNPEGTPPNKFSDLMRWQWQGGRQKWPPGTTSPHAGHKPEPRVGNDRIVVTQVGHATQLIQTANLNILTDPWWSERASPVSFAGPKRVNDPGIAFEDLPEIDMVLLSHNHYDHLDIATLKRLVTAHDPLIVTPLGNDKIVAKSVQNARFQTGDWGDVHNHSGDMKIHFEPCHHWSARGTRDRRMALWAAFVLETPAGRIYHIGDTGFHGGINYAAAAEKHGGFEVAISPIGAYEPRWFMKGQHQNPEEAVLGHIACKARVTLGHHWGTVQLTNEAFDAPPNALAEARQKHQISEDAFIAMQPGQSWDSAGKATTA